MKKVFTIAILLISATTMRAQEAANPSGWEFEPNLNVYLFKDDIIILPILKADKNKLHLEARYNYEDLKTASLWAGYNFRGAGKVEYQFTPMVAAVFGNTRGFSSGLEFTLNWNRIEFYTEMEYLVDSENKAGNFYYDWTDITYSITDWLWAGISAQRTKLFHTKVDLQRGLLVTALAGRWEISTYFYNIDVEEPFVLLSVSATF